MDSFYDFQFLFIGIVTTSLWLIAIYYLESKHFKSEKKVIKLSDDGSKTIEVEYVTRKIPIKTANDQIRSEEIRYHNNAIYRALEFYAKILLALVGGASYVLIQSNDYYLTEKEISVLASAGALILTVSCFFCIMVFSHMKSKIERWPDSTNFIEIFSWLETWLVFGCMTFSCFICDRIQMFIDIWTKPTM